MFVDDVDEERRRVLVPQAIHQHSARNPEDPWPQPRRVAQPADAADDPQPDVLNGVVRAIVGGRDPARVGAERPVPALDEVIEGVRLAELATNREPLVGGTRHTWGVVKTDKRFTHSSYPPHDALPACDRGAAQVRSP